MNYATTLRISPVGDMASYQYEQAYEVVTDAVEETGQIIRRNPLGSIGVGLGVGFLLGLIGRSRAARLTALSPIF